MLKSLRLAVAFVVPSSMMIFIDLMVANTEGNLLKNDMILIFCDAVFIAKPTLLTVNPEKFANFHEGTFTANMIYSLNQQPD